MTRAIKVGLQTGRAASAVLAGAALCAALAACGGAAAPEQEGQQTEPVPQGLLQRVSSALSGPTATTTATRTPTVTPTPSPTATPVSPLSIEYMRQQTYPGSPLTIESALEPGANYGRYVASYISEGLKINGLLTVPDGDPPPSGWPVIVFNHGYIPPTQYRTTERYVAYVDGFARRGYIVFKPDYRGHGSSEGEPTGAYWSPGYTIDVLNAVAALRQHPSADPNRIGMWGHSMGGSITLRAMVTTGNIRAGVIWAGVVAPVGDLLSNWHHPGAAQTEPAHRWPGSGRRQQLTSAYGSPEENPAFWASISPNSYLADVSGPIQLHHGTADREVPYAFSETLKAEMDAAGRSAELYAYPGGDHNLSASFAVAMKRSVAFFDQYVKGSGASGTGTP